MLDFLWKNAVFNLVYGPLIAGLAILLFTDDRATGLFLGIPLIAISLVTITIRAFRRHRILRNNKAKPGSSD
jgi:hypothetical protein